MSDAKAAEAKPDAKAKPQGQKKPLSLRFTLFVLMVMMIVFFPSTVLFCGCMLPTLVAAMIDSRPQKTAWLTVGAMNCAGIVPSWFELWHMGHTLQDAFILLFQAKTLLMAYGAAAMGWVIYYQVPSFVSSILMRRSDGTLKAMERRRKELIRKFGDEVRGEGN